MKNLKKSSLPCEELGLLVPAAASALRFNFFFGFFFFFFFFSLLSFLFSSTFELWAALRGVLRGDDLTGVF